MKKTLIVLSLLSSISSYANSSIKVTSDDLSNKSTVTAITSPITFNVEMITSSDSSIDLRKNITAYLKTKGVVNDTGAYLEYTPNTNISIKELDLSKGLTDKMVATNSWSQTVNNIPVSVNFTNSISYLASATETVDSNKKHLVVLTSSDVIVGSKLEFIPVRSRKVRSGEIINTEITLNKINLVSMDNSATSGLIIQLPTLSEYTSKYQVNLQNNKSIIIFSNNQQGKEDTAYFINSSSDDFK